MKISTARAFLLTVAAFGICVRAEASRAAGGPTTMAIGEVGVVGMGASGTQPGPAASAAPESERFGLSTRILKTIKLPGEFVAISQDGQRIAALYFAGRGSTMVFAGEPLPVDPPLFQDIIRESITISPDGKHLAFVAQDFNSRTSQVVEDGVASKPYNIVANNVLTFSPDSRHFAYYAQSKDGTGVLVMDGKEQPLPLAGMVADMLYSPDSKHLAVASHGLYNDQGNSGTIIEDGNVWAHKYTYIPEKCLHFSPDGTRLAALVVRGSGQCVVENDAEQPSYSMVLPNTLGYSPDSKRLVYGAFDHSTAAMVVNGKEIGRYNQVSPVTFSPDGKHWYFTAFTGTEQSNYAVNEPNGNMRMLSGTQKLVIDGKLTDSPGGEVYFSPDSKRTALVGDLQDAQHHVLGLTVSVDGGAPVQIRDPHYPQFSPDSAHFALLDTDHANGEPRLIIDGATYKYPLEGYFCRLTYDAPDTLHAITVNRNEVRYLELKLVVKQAEPATVIAAGPAAPDVQKKVDMIRHLAAAVDDPQMRAAIEGQIAYVYIWSGDTQNALATMKGPRTPQSTVNVLLAASMAESKRDPKAALAAMDEALAIAQKIENIHEPENAQIAVQLAGGYMTLGNDEGVLKALALNTNIPPQQRMQLAEQRVAMRLDAGDFTGAMSMVELLADPTAKQNELYKIAAAAEKKGDVALAAKIYREVLSSMASGYYDVQFLLNAGPWINLCRLGQGSVAAEEIKKLPHRQGSSFGVPMQFANWIDASLAAGDKRGAADLLAAVVSRLDPIGQNPATFSSMAEQRMHDLLQIATLQASVGDATGAATTLSAANDLVLHGPDKAEESWKNWQIRKLADIATIQSNAGLKDASASTLAAAWKMSDGITADADRYEVLSVLCKAQADTDDAAGALATLTKMPDLETLHLQPGWNVNIVPQWAMWCAIGSAQIRHGDRAAAMKSFDRAVNSAPQGPNQFGRPDNPPLAFIIATLAKAGDVDGVLHMLPQAQGYISNDDDSIRQAALALVRSGHVAVAKRVVATLNPGEGMYWLVMSEVGKEQVKSGDFAGGMETQADVYANNSGNSGFEATLTDLANAGDVDSVVKYLPPSYPELVTKLAQIRAAAGDKAGAKRILERGLEIDVGEEPAALAFIDGLSELGDYAEASALLENHLAPAFNAYAPGSVQPQQYDDLVRLPRLARIRVAMGDFPGAVALLSKIQGKDGRNRAMVNMASTISGAPGFLTMR